MINEELLTMALLKAKEPGNLVIVDDEVHHRYDEIVFEFLEYSTMLKVKNKDKIVYETNIDSILRNKDTLSLKANGTFKMNVSLS